MEQTRKQDLEHMLWFAKLRQDSSKERIQEQQERIENGKSTRELELFDLHDFNENYFNMINYEKAVECIERELTNLN